MNSELGKIKRPTEYIREAWKIYTKKENFIFFARIMAVLVIATSVISIVTNYFYPAEYLKNSDFSNIPLFIGFVVISIASIIIGLWSQTAQYFAILKMGETEKDVLKMGFKKMLRFFVISFAVGIVVVLGVILLIIPAVIFGVWYSFSIWLVLDKDMSVGEAMKKSKLMAKGKFWKILGRSVVFGFFSMIVSIILVAIPYAGPYLSAFITPLFLLPFYLLYKDLINN